MAIGWVVRLNEYKLQRTSDLDNLKILARSKMLARRRNTQTESPERSFTCLDDIQKDRSFNFFREFLLNQVVTNIIRENPKCYYPLTHWPTGASYIREFFSVFLIPFCSEREFGFYCCSYPVLASGQFPRHLLVICLTNILHYLFRLAYRESCNYLRIILFAN